MQWIIMSRRSRYYLKTQSECDNYSVTCVEICFYQCREIHGCEIFFQLQKNCCLTLCNFRIPNDLVSIYGIIQTNICALDEFHIDALVFLLCKLYPVLRCIGMFTLKEVNMDRSVVSILDPRLRGPVSSFSRVCTVFLVPFGKFSSLNFVEKVVDIHCGE